MQNNKSVAQVAREMDVNENTLYNWIKKYGQEPEVKSVQSFSSAEAEVRALRKGAAEGSMPERRHEKRPPFNEKGGVLLEAEPEAVGLEGVRRPPPNRPSALKSLFD
ncbi:hypothetical protein BACI349Y_900003 [Bacillus sp. 349Y]|nr:hypothetical protein BACI349Y_900003 [Bacillus sp. 349Y]